VDIGRHPALADGFGMLALARLLDTGGTRCAEAYGLSGEGQTHHLPDEHVACRHLRPQTLLSKYNGQPIKGRS
jgi:hypothetical protein